jgi:hypothetical protein
MEAVEVAGHGDQNWTRGYAKKGVTATGGQSMRCLPALLG